MSETDRHIKALMELSSMMIDRNQRIPISFSRFLKYATKAPKTVFRDIFQLMYDMFGHYVPPGIDEYEGKESIGFKDYDFEKMFRENCDNPFFADRLFANRLVALIDRFRKGKLSNHIFLFEGPPGSGKSTFLNNFLLKLEQFTRLKEGAFYKTNWRLDVGKLGVPSDLVKMLSRATDYNPEDNKEKHFISFSCPKHDHPVLQIPKQHRHSFLDRMLPDSEFKKKLFTRTEYEWVFREIPCSICRQTYETLLDVIGDPLEVYNMIYAKRDHFNRQFGQGISIFNPGDPLHVKPETNENLQKRLNDLFGDESISFIYSHLAKTNNGVYALMDVKEKNIKRLMNLHGIISDGVHKVGHVEERIKSVFMGVINPEDRKHYEKIHSFRDRVITVKIPYVLDYRTEVSIFKSKFGENIEKKFLPHILLNIARIIISSRLKKESSAIDEWLKNRDRYKKYLDENNLLLKMDLYSGNIPEWLSEEDVGNFTKPIRKKLISEADNEGHRGFSGRQSLNIFNQLLSKHGEKGKPVTMSDVIKFFKAENSPFTGEIPSGFIESLERMYDYTVLQEIKEAIYYYNKSRIARDIKNYLWAINFEPGETTESAYTGDTIDVSDDYLTGVETHILGRSSDDNYLKTFRTETQKEYVTFTLTQEMKLEGKDIEKTELYKSLCEKFKKNLKENALIPYFRNDNFRRAIKDFKTKDFKSYDQRMKRDVTRLMKNLQKKFNYSEEAARELCIYTLDKKLIEKYSDKN